MLFYKYALVWIDTDGDFIQYKNFDISHYSFD